MLNVAHIITKSEIGGAQTWVKDQMQLFDGDFNHYLITNKPGWLSNNIRCKDILYVEGIESKCNLVTLYKIISFIKNNNVDILVASSANAGFYARLCKLFTSCRIVYISHGWSCIYNGGKLKGIYILVERALSFLTDIIICVSKKDKKNALDIIKIRPNKLTYIRNGVFLGSSDASSKIVCQNESKEFKVLFLGRLSAPKRCDILINAINNIPNIKLDIIGDGPLRSELSCAKNIEFLGEIPNFNNFNNYNLFALISDSEGLPMSALEAASNGIPLLLSNVGGCPELIKNNGLSVENNVFAISVAIRKIMSNYESYKKGACVLSPFFNIELSKPKYFKVYTNCKLKI